jgi:hypothetical protein
MPPALLLVVALLLPRLAAGADAVAVNPDGTTQFTGTVSGPNLLATKAPGTITAATVLDGTAAGMLFKISGTTGDYAITLPSAALVPAGAIIAFSVAPYGSTAGLANKQFTIQPTSGQTLDGRSSLVLIHTNFLQVMSDGVNSWIAMIKKVDTDWVDGGAIGIASTNAPNPPGKGGTTRDKVWWRRCGDSMAVRYEYNQNTGGTAGIGHYLFAVPYTIDLGKVQVNIDTTTILRFYTYSVGVCSVSSPGIGRATRGMVSVYDNNHVRFSAGDSAGEDVVASGWMQMSYPIAYSASFMVPMVNW